MNTINVDIDGPLYDFCAMAARLDGYDHQGRWFNAITDSGLNMQQHIENRFYDYVENGVFANGNMTFNADILMDHIGKLKHKYGLTVNILGALPRDPNYTKLISQQKINWLDKNGLLKHVDEIILVEGSSSKLAYGNNKSVLIDDYPVTMDRFNEKGFPFILHTNLENTIKQLNNYGLILGG